MSHIPKSFWKLSHSFGGTGYKVEMQCLPCFPTQTLPTSVWTLRRCKKLAGCSPWCQCGCRWGPRSSCHLQLLIRHRLRRKTPTCTRKKTHPRYQLNGVELKQSHCFTNVAKYNAVLRGGHLDIGFDVSKIVRGQSQRWRLLHQLEISCGVMKVNLVIFIIATVIQHDFK